MSAWVRSVVVVLLGTLVSCDVRPPPHPGTINRLLGDESFVKRFGPDVDPAGVDEDVRIRVHLEYVLDLLRQRTPAGLSSTGRAARTRTLAHLEAYLQRGEFPHNHEHPGRRPTFIDVHGRICAVGFLLEQDLGRAAAEAIAAGFRSAYLGEMTSPVLADWVATTGLEREELEMIQPSYARERSALSVYGPAFASLDRVDGGTRMALETSALFERGRDGVPLRMMLALGLSPLADGELGYYTALALTKLAGADTSSSALGNVDLGFTHAWRLPQVGGRLLFRTGLLLPLGDEDELGASLNRAVAPQRLADAVLFQPGALGGRLGVSWTRSLLEVEDEKRFTRSSLWLRLEAGLDTYAPHDNPWQLSPRWGVGLGYLLRDIWVFTLEGAGARYPRHPSAPGELSYTVAGSLRFLQEWSFAPGVSVTVPLGRSGSGVFAAFELVYRARVKD